MKVSVITISDRAYAGVYEDLSGPEIENVIKEAYPKAQIKRGIVPDEEKSILKAFKENYDCDFIFTSGGTGISERDVTPDVTKKYCERELPGLSTAILVESLKETPNAMLSRLYAGTKGRTIIVNFPGSVKAAKLCAGVVAKIMPHALKMFLGESH
ncbi:MogA/MoaB family molybdenum cofactor biosynthesis protein [candidate division WOR-3 bacterium]|nr:MogA/MoaB family molybdenum cofactor biosynthesis protein [candidate division WOR-3 bacterium]